MNTRRLIAPYFTLQSVMVFLWWLTLWLHPPARSFFLPPGSADVFLLAFWLPDLVLIVVGSLIASNLCRLERASAGVALWLVVGASSYATLYCLALSLFTGAAWISVASMSAATFLSAGLGQGAAVGLYTGSALTLVYTIFGGVIWNYAVRPMEEADLAQKFGADYARYLAAVKCGRPRLTPFDTHDLEEGRKRKLSVNHRIER